MNKQIFVNLPIKSVTRTRQFFNLLGYTFNEQFSDEKALCLVIGKNIFAMLLSEPFFKTFIKKELVDAKKATEVLIALAVNSRQEVDSLMKKALAAGAREARDPQDYGYMYARAMEDLDGHIWEIFWMDPKRADSN